MDLSSVIGVVAGIGVLVALIMLDGGHFAQYYDVHAVTCIFGGATAATIIRFPFPVLAHALPQAMKCFMNMRPVSPKELVEEIANIADIARRQGPTALEKVEVADPVLAQGIRYIADGYDVDFIRDTMEKDKDNIYLQLDEAQKIFRSYGDCAPAFGMVGTLLGMVNMFANMSDPSKLGPYMAVALIATLYGAVAANLFCMPIADKIHVKMAEEDICRAIIIDGVVQIRNAKSPQLIKDMLMAHLTEHDRHHFAEAD